MPYVCLMASSRFPLLKQVYFERAKTARNRKLAGLGIALAGTVIYSFGTGVDAKSQIYFVITACFSIYFTVKLVALFYGIRNFDRMWEDHLDASLTDPQMLPMFEAVDSELEGELVKYKDVIFTRSYVIAFKKLGSFAMVRAITDVTVCLKNPQPYGFAFVGSRPYYELTCDVEPLGQISLSQDKREMMDIIDEIRYRNPGVELCERSMELLAA
jgi:hypothetical protein